MNTKRMTRTGMISGLLFLCGCFVPPLTIEADGQTVTMNVGDRITVTLDSNPSTGFEWTVAEMNQSILNSEKTYIQDTAPVEMAGVGGTEIWVFTALSEGTTMLLLEYRRPFQSIDLPAANTFELMFVVTAAG